MPARQNNCDSSFSRVGGTAVALFNNHEEANNWIRFAFLRLEEPSGDMPLKLPEAKKSGKKNRLSTKKNPYT
jgi:hypothetical protein